MSLPHLPPHVTGPPQPRRVVPLLADLGTCGGHRLVLLSAEIYDAWTDLRFARIDEGAPRPLPRRVPPADAWRVTTGDGQPVEVLDAVGRGDRTFSNGEVRLAPLPDGAGSLRVEVVLVPGEAPLAATVEFPAV